MIGKPSHEDLEQRIKILESELAEQKRLEEELKRDKEIFDRIIDTISEGFLLLNAEFLIQDVNPALIQILGCRREELIGKRADSLYDRKKTEFYYASRDHLSFETQFPSKDGRPIPILFNRSALRDEHGQISGYVVFLTDLTELKIVQEELKKAEQRYRRMYQNALQGMFQSTLSGKIIRVNPAYARLLGYDSPQDFMAKEKMTTPFYDKLADREKMTAALKEKGVLIDYELKLKRLDGAVLWVLANVRIVKGDGDESIIEGILVDNTARKIAEQKLKRSREKFRTLAILDNLTGLYNTRYLYKKLKELIDRCKIEGTIFSLIFMDMDNFKKIVDTYGHLNGSQALKEVAATIQESILAPAFGVAYGGDEFVVVLPGVDKITAVNQAEQIRNKMRHTLYLSNQGYQVNLQASFGVATFPEDAADLADLLAMADKAMFQVKEKGKNAVGMSPVSLISRGSKALT